jgi:glutamine amidotransferase
VTARSVIVIDYGAGNVRSVVGAFARLGVAAAGTADTDLAARADLCVLPGVGSAGAAMDSLRRTGMDHAIRDRVSRGAATLGICLGLHLALDSSEEDGGVAGLGIMSGRAVRIGGRAGVTRDTSPQAVADMRVPRIGWARLEPGGHAMYFAHSYAAITEAATQFSEGMVAEAQEGSFLGVQYHPEKSGPAGEKFLRQCL